MTPQHLTSYLTYLPFVPILVEGVLWDWNELGACMSLLTCPEMRACTTESWIGLCIKVEKQFLEKQQKSEVGLSWWCCEAPYRVTSKNQHVACGLVAIVSAAKHWLQGTVSDNRVCVCFSRPTIGHVLWARRAQGSLMMRFWAIIVTRLCSLHALRERVITRMATWLWATRKQSQSNVPANQKRVWRELWIPLFYNGEVLDTEFIDLLHILEYIRRSQNSSNQLQSELETAVVRLVSRSAVQEWKLANLSWRESGDVAPGLEHRSCRRRSRCCSRSDVASEFAHRDYRQLDIERYMWCNRVTVLNDIYVYSCLSCLSCTRLNLDSNDIAAESAWT